MYSSSWSCMVLPAYTSPHIPPSLSSYSPSPVIPQHSQVFPSHYHPQFTSSLSHHHQRASKRRQETRSIVSEEEEELSRYGGSTSEPRLFRGRGDRSRFPGSCAWERRWTALTQRVIEFEPDNRQWLSFAGTSCPPLSPTSVWKVGKREFLGSGKEGKITFKHENEGKKKAWYEGPSTSAASDLTFELPYISNLHTMTSSSNTTNEFNSHSSVAGNGVQQKHSYSTPSILPPAVIPGKRWRVVHVSVRVGRVVVYCGECEEEEEEGEGGGELGCLAVNRSLVKAVVVYQTDAMHYSITR